MKCFVFIDESGNINIKDVEKPIFVMGTVVTEKVNDLRRSVGELKEKYCCNHNELKTEYVSPENHKEILRELIKLPVYLYAHVYDKEYLPNFFEGKKANRKFRDQAKDAIINDITYAFAQYDEAEIFVDPTDPSKSKEKSMASFILDLRDKPVKEEILRQTGKRTNQISLPCKLARMLNIEIKTPKSQDEYGLQAADIVAGTVYRCFNNCKDLFKDIISDHFHITSFPVKKGDNYYGIPKTISSNIDKINPGDSERKIDFPELEKLFLKRK